MVDELQIVELIKDAYKDFGPFRTHLSDEEEETDNVFAFIDLTASTKYKNYAKSHRIGVARSLFHLLLCKRVVDYFKCTLVKFIGDEIMFRTNSSLKATEVCETVRVAYGILNDVDRFADLETVRTLAGIDKSSSISFEAKSGIAKGPTFAVPGFLSPNDGLGIPIDRAARCASKASPGAIVVDEGIRADLVALGPRTIGESLHVSRTVPTDAKGMKELYMAVITTDDERKDQIARDALDPLARPAGIFEVVDIILDALQLAGERDVTAERLSNTLRDVMNALEKTLAQLREIDRKHVRGASLMLVYTKEHISQMRKAYESISASENGDQGPFLARRIPFVAPKWSEPLPDEDQDVYITVEFRTDERPNERDREHRLTLCGNKPRRSRKGAAMLSTLNSYFFPDILTVYRYAYGLAADGENLTRETAELIKQNYELGSWQARQVRIQAGVADFRSSMRLKVIDKNQCVGYVNLDSDLAAYGIVGSMEQVALERQERRLAELLRPLIRQMAPPVAKLRNLHIQEFESSPRLAPDIVNPAA